MPIDYSKPDWPERVRAAEAHKKKMRKSQNAVQRIRSRAYRMALDTIGMVHNNQDGRCANLACRVQVDILGRRRAFDTTLNVILCKQCSLAMGLAQHDPKRLRGLADLLEHKP